METIIIWIVIIAVGAAFEWVKKKSAPSDNEPHPTARISRPAPCDADWSTINPSQPTVSRQPEPRKPQIPKPASVANTVTPTSLHAYKPLTNLPANDTPIQVEELDDSREPQQSAKMTQQELVERQAHYDRWRKAILDTQILERKF